MAATLVGLVGCGGDIPPTYPVRGQVVLEPRDNEFKVVIERHQRGRHRGQRQYR